MESSPAELLLAKPCARSCFVPCLSAADLTDLLACSRFFARWSKPPRLPDLLRAWGESWASDLFATARTYQAVLLREARVSRMAAAATEIVLVGGFPCAGVSHKTSEWLQSLAKLRAPAFNEMNFGHIKSLLGSNLHSSAMWTCCCAVVLTGNYPEFGQDSSFESELQASLNDYEVERFFEVGLRALVLLRRVDYNGLLRRPPPSVAHMVGFRLACRGLHLWPQNCDLVLSAFTLVQCLLPSIPEGPLIRHGALADFIAQAGRALHFNPGWFRFAFEAFEQVSSTALNQVYDTAPEARVALHDLVHCVVEHIKACDDFAWMTATLEWAWALLGLLAERGPGQLGRDMLAGNVIEAIAERIHLMNEYSWDLHSCAGFLVILARCFGVNVLSPIARGCQDVVARIRDEHPDNPNRPMLDVLLAMLPYVGPLGSLDAEKRWVTEQSLQSAAAEEDVKAAEATERSLQSADTEEGGHVAEAVMRTKSDATVLSGDGVVVLRLTRMARSPQVAEVLATAPAIAHCRTRVIDAGCEVSPSWACGATFLVPMTPEQLAEFEECGVELQAHHIVALARDVECVKAALQAVPNRQRPRLAVQPPASPANAGAAAAASSGGVASGSQGARRADGGPSEEDEEEPMVEIECFIPTASSLVPSV